MIGATAQNLLRFAERGERFAGDLEPQHVAFQSYGPRLMRQVASCAPGHERLELPNGFASSSGQPRRLCFRRGDARQLSRRRPTDAASSKRLIDLRKVLKCVSDTQLLVGCALIVSEEPLDVLPEAGIAEVAVNLSALRTQQPFPLFGVLLRSTKPQGGKRLVRFAPVVPRRRGAACCCRHQRSVHPHFRRFWMTEARAIAGP
jgi:hypothetical protein